MSSSSLSNFPSKTNPINGKIFKGTINDAQVKITSSSIPAKKQTVIFRNPTVSAFGSGVNRFLDRNIQEPGPGNYTKMDRSASNPSFSKKGYGPLLSNKQRLLNIKRNTGPGPGSYIKLQNSKLIKNNSSIVFARQYPSHEIFKQQIRTAQKIPGPGNYDYINKDIKSSTFMFKSTLQRNVIYTPDGPPSTKYQIKPNTFNGKTFQIKKPNPIIKKQNMLAKLFGKQKISIGPGTYDYQINKKSKTYTIKQGSTDRFGNLKEQFINNIKKSIIVPPGPGSYEYKELPSWKQSRGFGNVFESRTDRKVFEGEKGLPQFYEYSSPNKKQSFLLNAKHKWV